MSCTALQQLLDPSNADFEVCFSTSSAAQEHGKKFRFENNGMKAICRVKVDGCLITSQQTKKCDYLFAVREDKAYYLVELKGINIDNAVAQIIQTFDIVNAKVKATPLSYTGVIVSSSVPAAAEQRFRRLQEKVYREKHLRIKKTHVHHIERI
ncbi:hypothetical protein ACQ86N_02560 [Puia sp. P3]|uniref:hypothetical protein n=1 Tax=Puia sp. P3 TaxID=3423952 RepID=UPI003D665DBB